MKTPLLCGRVSWTLAGSLLLIALLTSVAGAQAAFNFSPGGFTAANVCASSSPGACQILTNTSTSPSDNLPSVIPGGILRLNSAAPNQHGSAWYYVPQPLSTGFTTAFQFTISGSGDGLAFVIQGDPAGTAAIGFTGDGQNMSYGNYDLSAATGPNRAILNSLAVELDTYQNYPDYGDPDANHIAVQSCGPNTPSALVPNSADHTYICANSQLAKLALKSLSGVSLADGRTHTITVNYLPPGNCVSACNNFSVYLDSALVLQITLNLSQQLALDGNGAAYIGFTSSTGAAVENNDIVSWSFSQLPLAPITITQPLQTTTTTFNFTPTLSAAIDYSQSGVDPTATQTFMQSTVQAISNQQFLDLVANTPFQGSTCLSQDLGQGVLSCVTTTVLCTNAASSTPAGANCTPPGGAPSTIGASNTFTADQTQKPITAPGYLMGKDTALSCTAAQDNSCKGLINIFTSIVGDPTVSGKTKNFNSILIPVQGVPGPATFATPAPLLTNSWVNQPVTVSFTSSEAVPGTNHNSYSTLPTVTGINYSATGANPVAPGVITGATGSIVIPAANEGTTTLTFYGTDSSFTNEAIVTNSTDSTGHKVVATSLPTLTINTDTTKPTVNCIAPAAVWQMNDVSVPCTASDNPTGSGLANAAQSSFSVSTSVPAGTETSGATIAPVTVFDVAGNATTQGPFGPFLVDKKAPVIGGLTISPAAPVQGQAVTASYNCADGGSGVVLCGPSGSSTIAATASTGTLTSAADGSVGTHTFLVNARDLAGNVSAPVSVSYTVSALPQLSVNPSSIAFGTVKWFSLTVKTITVQNTGTLPVVFQSVKLTQTESDGGRGRQFLMLNGCGSQLAVGASCSVKIAFVASEVVSAAGTVTFVDNAQGAPQTVQITGTVVKR